MRGCSLCCPNCKNTKRVFDHQAYDLQSRELSAEFYMDNIKECYKLLELEPNSPEEDVKRQRMFWIETLHPDRLAHNPSVQKKAEEKLKNINAAYDTIMKYLSTQSKGGSTSAGSTGEKKEKRNRREPNQETVTTIEDDRVRELLNKWSIESNCKIKYLGAFADDIVASSTNAIKVVITTTTINRGKEHRQRPGNEYRESDEREGGCCLQH